MPNMSLKKNEMPSQAPDVRNKNFLEVALGYTEEQAVDEAQRCLHCKNKPCVAGCPVAIHIPDFIAKVAEGDFEGAYQIITQPELPARRVRPGLPPGDPVREQVRAGHQGRAGGHRPPGAVCGRLAQRATSAKRPAKPASNGHKVAVVGSGPSGLTCAGDLAKKGYDVTVFEALHTGRRRAGVRHPGVPAAQGHRAEGNRQPEGPGRGRGDQHGHRPGALHRRAVGARATRRCSSAPARGCPGL